MTLSPTNPTGSAGGGKKSGIMMHLAAYMVLLALLAYFLGRGGSAISYHWQWYRVIRYVFTLTPQGVVPGPLLTGLFTTLRITAASLVLAFCIGLVAVVMRLSGSVIARALSRIYLELIRNTPLLVQIFFLYFVVSPIVGMDAFATGVVALSLFEGAYISEIFRAGILSVPQGQWDAARSLGLGTVDTYCHVILPQAVRSVVPSLAGQAISLVKDSALVSTIAVYDIAMQAHAIVAETFLVFEVWLTVAAVYLTITLGLSVLAHTLESRFHRYGV